jgi:predicted nucleic acid-binding protein
MKTAQRNNLPIKETVQSVLNNITAFRRDFTVINETNDTLDKWLSLLPQITTSRDVFDFNIAATLQSAGINHILTHNVSDFKKFSNWLTVLPLVVSK